MSERTHYTLENYRAPNSIGYLLSRAQAMMRPLMEGLFEQEQISFTQWRVLMCLRDTGAKTGADLSRHLFHDKGSMTRLLDQLECRGLVSRHRDTDDRRVVEVALTEEGRALVASIAPRLIAYLNELLKDFSSDELQALTRLLHKLNGALEEKEKDNGLDVS